MRDRLSGEPEVLPTLFIGKWTVKIMYSLRKDPSAMGSCDVVWEASPSECLQGRFAISSPLD